MRSGPLLSDRESSRFRVCHPLLGGIRTGRALIGLSEGLLCSRPLPPYRSEGTSLAAIRRRVATIVAAFQRERSGRRVRCFAHARDPEWAADLARAYNDFVYDYYLKQSSRLKAVALIPVQAPHAAAQELRRAVTEPGMVGVVLPAPGLSRPYGDRAFDPLYETANALGTMLAVHGASRRDLGFDFYHATETRPERAQGDFIVAHPLAQIVQFVNLTLERVFERFPNMKGAFLEAGCGWVPYFIERIDRRTQGLASAQVQQYPVYFHAELAEKEVLTTCIKVLGGDRLVYASDYPHEPEDEIIESLQQFLGREDLSLRSKEKIVRDNIKVLYGM